MMTRASRKDRCFLKRLHDGTNVLCKPLSVVLEPVDKLINAKAANHNKRKTGCGVRDDSIVKDKNLNGNNAENNYMTRSQCYPSKKICNQLSTSVHHVDKKLKISDQKTATAQSFSLAAEQRCLRRSPRQSRRQLRNTNNFEERRPVCKKPVCLCCADEEQMRPVSAGLKKKHERHMEECIRTRNANMTVSIGQKRKKSGDASHTNGKKRRRLNANCHSMETLKTMSETLKNGQSARNRKIVCHNDSNSAIPTSCAAPIPRTQARARTSSQPPSVLRHLEVHTQYHRRSASAPPPLKLDVDLKADVNNFMDVLQNIAAHLQKHANGVRDLLSDDYFQHMIASISHLRPKYGCHSPNECLMMSIHLMKILKERMSAEFKVASDSSIDKVCSADSNGGSQLEANVEGRASTEADVGGVKTSVSAPQSAATMAKSKIMVSAEANMSSRDTTFTDSRTAELSDEDRNRYFSDRHQLEANIEENFRRTTHETTDIVFESTTSESPSEFGATFSSVTPRIMEATAGTLPSTSYSPTGGTDDISTVHEENTVASDGNHVKVPLAVNTGNASSKSNCTSVHKEPNQDATSGTIDSVCLSMEEHEVQGKDKISESDSELEITGKNNAQNVRISGAVNNSNGEEEESIHICEVLDLTTHTGNEVQAENLGQQVQDEPDENNTGNAGNVAMEAASIPAPHYTGDDADRVNELGEEEEEEDGDIDYGGEGNEDCAGSANSERDNAHNIEEILNDDALSDGPIGDERNFQWDNIYGSRNVPPMPQFGQFGEGQFGVPLFDAAQYAAQRYVAQLDAARIRAAQFAAGQHAAPQYWAPRIDMTGGYAGPNFRSINNPDVVAVHAMITTVEQRAFGARQELCIRNEFRVFSNGFWRVFDIPDF